MNESKIIQSYLSHHLIHSKIHIFLKKQKTRVKALVFLCLKGGDKTQKTLLHPAWGGDIM